MTRNTKPAAWANAAGSINGALCRHAARTEYEASNSAAQARLTCLRTLADIVSMGASEAPNRDSAERLRDAAARIFDAIGYERRALCGRRA